MNMTRKTFCASLAGSTVTLLLQACGGGGYSSGGSVAGGSTCGASGTDISANHNHSLTIQQADLNLLTDKTYVLSASGDGHVHSVTFTPAQFATLKSRASVTVTSTMTAAGGLYGGTHDHTVTATVLSTCA
jgi:hypothetical protein